MYAGRRSGIPVECLGVAYLDAVVDQRVPMEKKAWVHRGATKYMLICTTPMPIHFRIATTAPKIHNSPYVPTIVDSQRRHMDINSTLWMDMIVYIRPLVMGNVNNWSTECSAKNIQPTVFNRAHVPTQVKQLFDSSELHGRCVHPGTRTHRP